jgi:hypothetical protein
MCMDRALWKQGVCLAKATRSALGWISDPIEVFLLKSVPSELPIRDDVRDACTRESKPCVGVAEEE